MGRGFPSVFTCSTDKLPISSVTNLNLLNFFVKKIFKLPVADFLNDRLCVK